jgi:OOP family OmpA-OmpF porin
MPDSIFTSLQNMLDDHIVGEVAHSLGQPEQSVSRGLESSIATVLGGLANKAGDTGALQKLLDFVPHTQGGTSFSQLAGSIANPGSPLMAAGSRMLGSLFGNKETAITSGLSRESGLPLSSVRTLLLMAGPMVLGFLRKRMADTGTNLRDLGGQLQSESASIRNFLPASVTELLWPSAAPIARESPVVAQSVQREQVGKSSNWPLVALCAALLGMGLLWMLNRSHRPPTPAVSIPTTGSANRSEIPTPKPICSLPAGVNLPEGGALSRFWGSIQDPNAKLSETWVNVDQIRFDTGSARLAADSKAQLDNLAAILKSCPTVNLSVAGYTDNVGSPDANLRLSRNRANAVVARLTNEGVSSARLTAEGYGEDSPVADNSTAEGRAENRRIAMRVTKK